MKRKVGNSGFSLVELIVVVLIMAIIAVAMAPNVMQWVENARQAKDINMYNQMYSDVQIVMADNDTLGEMKSAANDYYVVMTSTGSFLRNGSSDTDKITSGAVYEALETSAPGWQSFKMMSTELATQFEIKIAKADGEISSVEHHRPILEGNPWD